MTYAEKLKDPRWQKKRLEIMQRDKFTCQHCKSKKYTLHIHHEKYSYGCEPWDIDSKYLITLCEDCHWIIEKIGISTFNRIVDILQRKLENENLKITSNG